MATDVFSPVDEAQHYDYIRSMAEGDGPPAVGSDRLSEETRSLVKASSAGWWRAAAVSSAVDDDRWGSVGESYEGVQPPLYYALLAPVYKLAHAVWGPLTTVFVLRLASLLLALLCVPIVYLLARVAFPTMPATWLLSPTILVVVPGFTSNLGALTNDAFAVSLGAAVVAAFIWSVRAKLSASNGLVCGVLVGLAALAKSTAIGLVPLLGVAAVLVGWQQGSLRRLLTWVAAAAGAATVVYSPWLVWNFVTYGGPSAADQVDVITGPHQATVPRSLGGVWMHLRNAMNGFWDHGLSSPGPGRLSLAMFGVVGALLIVGGAALWVRRRRHDALTMLGLGSAVAVSFAWMLFLIFVVFDGRSSVVGRHLYPALGPLVGAMAAAAIAVGGRRLGPLLLAALMIPLGVDERHDARFYLDYTYTWGVYDGMAPAVVQSYADDARIGATVTLDAGCAVQSVGLMFNGHPPPEVTGMAADQPVKYPRVLSFERHTSITGVYRLPAAQHGTLMLEVDPPASLLVSRRDVRIDMDAGRGDPAVLVYCAGRPGDQEAVRFRQVYGSAHPRWIGIDLMRTWAAVATWIAPLSLIAAALVGGWPRRRRAAASASEEDSPGVGPSTG